MKIAVLVKKVPETASAIKLSADSLSIVGDGLKYILNPYDEFAVEEAIKIKEAKGGEVVLVHAGSEDCDEVLRFALAMGADRAIHIKDPGLKQVSSRGAALALAAALKPLAPDLILAGKQAVDDDAAQVPERVAELLELPHVSVVTKIELTEKGATVHRDVEGGSYTVNLPFPAVVTTQKGINTPRYPALPNIMKAKKREIAITDLAKLSVDPSGLVSKLRLESLSLPKQERKNRILKGDPSQAVHELVTILHQEEKAI